LEGTMRKRHFLLLLIPFGLCSNAGIRATAQDDGRILINVNLVQLNVAVTDNKGSYISGLDPKNFIISEDRIPQKVATFEEGNGPTRSLIDESPSADTPLTPAAIKTAESGQSHPLNAPGQIQSAS
jgi:Ca-activated chloride channel family protein